MGGLDRESPPRVQRFANSFNGKHLLNRLTVSGRDAIRAWPAQPVCTVICVEFFPYKSQSHTSAHRWWTLFEGFVIYRGLH